MSRAAAVRRAPTRKAQQGGDSRRRILDAASELMTERGFAGTSISEVSRLSGLPASSIYWHFESKEGLLGAVVEEGAQRWFESLPAPAKITGTPGARAAALLRAAATSLEQGPEFLRLMLLIALERKEIDKTSLAMIRRVRRLALERIESLIALEMAPRNAQLGKELAMLVLAAADGIFIQHHIDPRATDVPRTFELLRRALAAFGRERRVRDPLGALAKPRQHRPLEQAQRRPGELRVHAAHQRMEEQRRPSDPCRARSRPARRACRSGTAPRRAARRGRRSARTDPRCRPPTSTSRRRSSRASRAVRSAATRHPGPRPRRGSCRRWRPTSGPGSGLPRRTRSARYDLELLGQGRHEVVGEARGAARGRLRRAAHEDRRPRPLHRPRRHAHRHAVVLERLAAPGALEERHDLVHHARAVGEALAEGAELGLDVAAGEDRDHAPAARRRRARRCPRRAGSDRAAARSARRAPGAGCACARRSRRRARAARAGSRRASRGARRASRWRSRGGRPTRTARAPCGRARRSRPWRTAGSAGRNAG